ncbi:N-formylglutamate amidohydrolase [Clostridium sp. DSM 8431]|uniref:N-formylglutamate amidohydrolase n=1 Tax=Clostridium sp. DSM 8431 TaxID=1761781 RepID=UPI0008E282D3|nr:N-formylglutamate amidohydrolase [Clostridium sp. DSM 8431]SFU35513.1 N-formylglutamate amidohydrolase [Clostridium sp. DSM 8431]
MKEESIFEIYNKNSNTYPLIVSMPHSGTVIPSSIKEKLKKDAILSNSDWFLPELYDFLKNMDITILENKLNRYVIDVNRKVHKKNPIKFRTSLVFQATAYGKEIYKSSISKKEIEDRIRFYYNPYHNTLESLIKEKLKHFKKVYLLDLHSYYDKQENTVLISNQNNKSSSKESLNKVSKIFRENNFKVKENELFLGGFITEYYGNKFKNKLECIQIELPYNIYIEDRQFGDEVVNGYDEKLFLETKNKLVEVFNKIKGLSH